MKTRFPLKELMMAVALASSFTAAPVVYADGGGYNAPSSKSKTCKKKGYVWSKKKKKCVKTQKSSEYTDDDIYLAGRTLAYEERYGEAIAILKFAKNKKDPRILNFLGYSTRKAGNVQAGLRYYKAAIAADPDYTLARSYMGEAYVTLGNLDAARNQLKEIEARCGRFCREYRVLDKAIKQNS